jgi:hypothetical protein
MTMNEHSPYVKASFYSSFFDPSEKKKLSRFSGLPVSPINHGFLQTPLWLSKPTFSTPKKPPQKQSNSAALQQAIYILPKSPSNVSIYLQVPQFRSMSFLLRCGHVSRLVENWLCNPMDQLKKAASVPLSQDHRRESSSLLSILPSSFSSDAASQSGSLSVIKRTCSNHLSSSLTVHIQERTLEFEYTHVPSSLTIVCVTYHLGHVSLSVNQVESLDILLSSHALNSFLIKCQLQLNHPVTIHQTEQYYRSPLPMICDFEYNNLENPSIVMDTQVSNTLFRHSPLYIEEISIDTTQSTIRRCIEDGEHHMVDKEDMPTTGFMHYQETYQEEDDDEESGLYSSSEEFSLIDEDDHDQDLQDDIYYEDAYERAQAALLRLAQDTLQYIQSSSQGALAEGLNSLEQKLYDYCRKQTV